MVTAKTRRLTRAIAISLAAAVGGTIAYGLWILAGEPAATEGVFTWVYQGVIVVAGTACLLRALQPGELQAAWAAFGAGLMLWGAADIYWTEALYDLDEIPYPSWADVGYLAALPCFFVGVASLVKHRVGKFTSATWLDGTTAALAAAAAATAFLAPALVGLTDGDPAAVLTNLAYPLGDLILVGFLIGALTVTGFRRARAIILLCSGLLVWCAGDIYYLYLEGTSGWEGGWWDLSWLIGAALIAAGAYPSKRSEPRTPGIYRSSLVPPAIATLAAASILVWDHFDRLAETSIWLSAATILAAVVRLTLSFRENHRLVRALHGEAVTDALTGLGNRRRLINDLDDYLGNGAGPDGGSVFAMFDLDGFKSYNDSFGHPAGDALLQRLGTALERAVAGSGTAYRLGGDEFCVLAKARGRAPEALVESLRVALSEQGEGFSIGASAGWILVPFEAHTANEALRITDQKMYAEKSERSIRSGRQTQDLLVRILREREPSLSEHVGQVSRRALMLGRRLGLDHEELDALDRAAQLHDIGKIAIPDDILNKAAPLDELEWRLMKRHTLIGERILAAATGNETIGSVVRSSHENWDGSGYPDGLAGREIPLQSRIILISDAFDAMTTDRPYRKAVGRDAALAELRRRSSTQFDPALVEAFCELIESDADGVHEAPMSIGANGNGRLAGVRLPESRLPRCRPEHPGRGPATSRRR